MLIKSMFSFGPLWRKRRLLSGVFLIFLIASMQLPSMKIHSARAMVLNAGNPDAKRLYDDLLSNYNKLVRPVVNTTDPLTVRIKLKLSQLIDVVSQKKSFTFD